MKLTALLRDPPRPTITEDRDGLVVVLDDVLSPRECADLVEAGERVGFDGAPITVGPGKFVYHPEVRDNTRAMVDDPELAAALWSRLQLVTPALVVPDWRPVGLNERLRWYRYQPGQAFRWHRDGSFARRDREERSFYTVLLYLTEGFDGGHTELSRQPPVVPRTGRALVFSHPLLHQGAPVREGTKYVLRTDLMFARAHARSPPEAGETP
ncbi:MAG: 2OG-Fe(II) oxygenase [Myxococcota bacterium]